MEEILSAFSPNDPLPLVRLVVDISGFPSISHKVFGAKFIGRIANPDSLLLLKKKRIYTTNDSGQEVIEENSELSHMAQFDYMSTLIEKSLKEMGNLEVLNNQHMREACKSLCVCCFALLLVSQFVNKGCGSSWHSMSTHFNKLADDLLKTLDLSKANPENVVKLIREEYARDSVDYMNELT